LHLNRIIWLAWIHSYEVCGLLSRTPGGEPAMIYEAVNVSSKPATSYAISANQQHKFFADMESNGTVLQAIWHSHPRSAPIPSTDDIQKAFHPDAAYVIVGLDFTAGSTPSRATARTIGSTEYVARAYSIIDGAVSKVPIETV
jgi:proteasome lid subunit RPN8/RPN11